MYDAPDPNFLKTTDESKEMMPTAFQADRMMLFLNALFLNELKAFKNFILLNVSSSLTIASFIASACQCFRG
jgi:hypothetical protein